MQDTSTEQAAFVQHMGAEWRARPCARCDHRSDEHRWRGTIPSLASLPVPCMVAACTCEAWSFEPKRAKKA
ncbi:MAG: hypothetical protein IT305_30440 [Chloroflexi bacterium]|nr:hypothetical protein [Chloroflexota bacterium]